uniref:Uroporphyrinogen decarboxylase (URO-D) domain-containing protein n=1 Tax=Chaetoceros debilis TaxID=122233 RepID=A0A7S3PZF6_9STRA
MFLSIQCTCDLTLLHLTPYHNQTNNNNDTNSYANEKLSHMGFDVITMDGEVERSTARDIVGDKTGLQGNYNPRELIPGVGEDGEDKTADTVRASAKQLLDDLGPQRLIANLGEGLGGKESPELVQVFIDTIHEYSEELIKKD